MEGSTVSPPPASPTGGDHLCGIKVTSVATDGVTLLTCLCGLPGNGAVLWLLLGFGVRRSPIIVYIFHLAVISFLFLLCMVPSIALFLLEDISCSTTVSLKYVRVRFLLSLFSYNTGLYLLTALSIERCSSILCPLRCRCLRPQRRAEVVNVLLEAISIAVIATVAALCLPHWPGHCQEALVSMYTLSLLLFAPSLVIYSTILLIKAKCGSQQQQPKRLDIVLLLAVLFTLPLSICNFLQQLGYSIMSSQAVFLLTCTHRSINPFVYFLVGSCWKPCSVRSLQLCLQRIFEQPEGNTPSSNDAPMDMAV